MRKFIVKLLGISIILAGLIFGGIGLKRCWQEAVAGKEYEELREQVVVDLPKETPMEEQEEEKPVVIPIDFAQLTAQYPDVYAWIRIPGTRIDYPIAQREGDNGYYLNHTVDGRQRMAGAIYTEDYNSKSFDDANTVIYGHNMKNGSMFKHLHKYRNKEFFSENPEILIYQPNRVLHYKIFAAYVYDNRHLLTSFDFDDSYVYEEYLNNVLKKRAVNGNVDKEISVTSQDRIITLSTCTGNDSQRYLVQAVLLSIEE